jgi:hypothetical protein
MLSPCGDPRRAPRDTAILRETGALPESKFEVSDVAMVWALRLRRAVNGEPRSNSWRPIAREGRNPSKTGSAASGPPESNSRSNPGEGDLIESPT